MVLTFNHTHSSYVLFNAKCEYEMRNSYSHLLALIIITLIGTQRLEEWTTHIVQAHPSISKMKVKIPRKGKVAGSMIHYASQYGH